MRKLFFVLLACICTAIYFQSCKKEKPCDDCGVKPIDTTGNTTDTTNKGDVAGPLRLTVRLFTPAGNFAGGAKVKFAYTFDSVNSEKYFMERQTNDSGYVIINNLPVKSPYKSYFVNASVTYSGEELSSTNPGGNGPREVRLYKNLSRNEQLIVTSP